MIFQVLITQVIIFVAVVLVMRKILITSSYKETSRLQQLNEENAQKSQELARQLLDAEQDYKQKIMQAEDEVREMKSQARKEVDDLKEAIINRGKAESEHIIAEALSSKKEMRSEIEGEFKERTVGLSCEIFKKVLSSEEQKNVFDGLLASVLTELEELDKERLKAIDFGNAAESTVEVKTSHALNVKQKEKLEAILTEKFDQKIVIAELLDKSVISGIIILMNSFVIDGSLSERFRRAAEESE